MKSPFELLLEHTALEQIGALHYERSSSRSNHRNGNYQRDLLTRFGLMVGLAIPRFRHGGLTHSLFAPYQQRTNDLDKALGTFFLNGICIHKIKGIAKQLTGRSVTAQTVPQIMQQTDEELERIRVKPLEDTSERLFFGRYL